MVAQRRKQLFVEIALLQKKLALLEKKYHQPEFLHVAISKFFPGPRKRNEAVYFTFDKRFEYISGQFSEIFGYGPEEHRFQNLQAQDLIALGDRGRLKRKYMEWPKHEFSVQHVKFKGLRRDGSEIDCESIVLLFPYKWGIAIHGMIRRISE